MARVVRQSDGVGGHGQGIVVNLLYLLYFCDQNTRIYPGAPAMTYLTGLVCRPAHMICLTPLSFYAVSFRAASPACAQASVAPSRLPQLASPFRPSHANDTPLPFQARCST